MYNLTEGSSDIGLATASKNHQCECPLTTISDNYLSSYVSRAAGTSLNNSHAARYKCYNLTPVFGGRMATGSSDDS
ncbi:Hypothetical protein NTJ_10785 [Nesidiocoris tenuis]|uniref:Uncharacterized protein n=1 Tax=Nesidiocoris tenuis TaxID=355587 RepID=A0ABN7B0M6_9HEMI|nr:Hypothetical protein NTJ_10785 [Nesidiocoris tenuis]